MSQGERQLSRRTVAGPRVAGTALMAASAATGVFAAIFVPNPQWGIPAAILVAFSSVGFLAGLLMVQRSSWADKTWPPGGRARSWNPQRERRTMLYYGVFVLVISTIGAVVLLAASPGSAPETVRTWVLIAAFALVGAVFVVTGARQVPEPVDSSTRPDGPTIEGNEWVQMGPDGSVSSQSWATATPLSSFQGPILMMAFLPILLRAPPWLAVTVIASIAAVVVVTLIVVRRQRKMPSVKNDGSAIRRGSREITATDVTAASLFWAPSIPNATERSLTITFAGTDGFRATVGLRKRGHLVLSHAETAALAELVSRSSIEIPRDEDDPKGRFSKVLYPTHLTKNEALSVTRHPPGDGDDLPVVTAPSS